MMEFTNSDSQSGLEELDIPNVSDVLSHGFSTVTTESL
jgi:hypothetical protein